VVELWAPWVAPALNLTNMPQVNSRSHQGQSR
jgi:hypothetical protein